MLAVITIYTVKLDNSFEALEEERDNSGQVQEKWEINKKAYYQTSKATLGSKPRQHTEWISAVTWEHIQERKRLKTVIGQTKSDRLKERVRIKYSELNKVMDKDGKLLTTEKEQERRWTEHFNEVLNRPDPQHPADFQPAKRDLGGK